MTTQNRPERTEPSARLATAVVLAMLSGIVAGLSHAQTVAPILAPPTPFGIAALLKAYPDHLERIDGNDLVWKDGSRMTIGDGRVGKTATQRLESADIKDMLVEAYPAGAPIKAVAFEADPGRARNPAFFDKMYGDCRKGEVNGRLVDVVWLPKKWGKSLKVTSVNGVDKRLAAVSRALDELPAIFDVYLMPPAGTVNCRAIAGTSRLSAHGHGIAIDLALPRADYWRWDRTGADGRFVYKNRFPSEIVDVFERHGFIWGGRWYHFDTMHFEYRPELLSP